MSELQSAALASVMGTERWVAQQPSSQERSLRPQSCRPSRCLGCSANRLPCRGAHAPWLLPPRWGAQEQPAGAGGDDRPGAHPIYTFIVMIHSTSCMAQWGLGRPS